jgi:hypothetical protein
METTLEKQIGDENAERKADSSAMSGSEVPTPRTDEDVRLCRVISSSFGEMVGADFARKLERENKMLVDALVKAAGYLASVRTDRKLIRDGDEYALQTMDWANGALEYAEAANAALETYDAAGLPNADLNHGEDDKQ